MDIKKINYTLLISCSLTWAIMIFMNYAAGTGWLFENSVGEVSGNFPILITPAGFTFSIWGVIYVFWTLFLIQLWRKGLKKDTQKITKSALAYIGINLINAFWIYFWTKEYLLISVVLIVILLILLVKLNILLKAEIVSVRWTDLVFVHWSTSIYLGWVILATVLNISVYLKSLGVLLDSPNTEWIAVALLIISTMIYLFLILQRNMRETGLVGIWGFSGISQAHMEMNPTMAYSALILIIVLGLAIFWNFRRNRFIGSKESLKIK
jgi:hypothetical protein